MSSTPDYHANARNWAVDILRGEKYITSDLILTTAQRAAQAQQIFYPNADVNVEKLAAELRHLFSVSAEVGTVLEDSADHVPWYPARRAQVSWRFWNRYVTFLERDFGMPPAVVLNLDDLTSMILERLE